MFDKHVHVLGGSQSHYHTHTVTEKRAPTDESVRLLKEFEREAQEKVLKSVRLENTSIDCVIHHQKDAMNLDALFLIQYRLNGKEVRVKHRADALGSREEIAEGLVEALAQSVACELLAGVANQLRGAF